MALWAVLPAREKLNLAGSAPGILRNCFFRHRRGARRSDQTVLGQQRDRCGQPMIAQQRVDYGINLPIAQPGAAAEKLSTSHLARATPTTPPKSIAYSDVKSSSLPRHPANFRLPTGCGSAGPKHRWKVKRADAYVSYCPFTMVGQAGASVIPVGQARPSRCQRNRNCRTQSQSRSASVHRQNHRLRGRSRRPRQGLRSPP